MLAYNAHPSLARLTLVFKCNTCRCTLYTTTYKADSLLRTTVAFNQTHPSHRPSAGRVFSVFPNQAEVGPSQSAQFRVSFRPKRDNAYYAAQLECFAVRKAATHSSLETGRARNAEQLAAQPVPLPWALVVDAVGHTFQGAQESLPMVAMSAQQVRGTRGGGVCTCQQELHELVSCMAFVNVITNNTAYAVMQPDCSASSPASPHYTSRLVTPLFLCPSQVEFPAGYVGSSSSQVVSLFNQGATPVTFEASVTAGADDAGIDAPFAVYPSCGVVPPASRQLLALRFSAKEARVFAGKLKVSSKAWWSPGLSSDGDRSPAAAVACISCCHHRCCDHRSHRAMYIIPTCPHAHSLTPSHTLTR